MAKGDELLDRLIEFGVSVMLFAKTVPKSTASCHMADQLVRSATACAPNYAEARGGESLRDFVHKLGIVRKELNESHVWLRMFEKVAIGNSDRLDTLIKECDELCRIISASKKTAEERLKRELVGRKEF